MSIYDSLGEVTFSINDPTLSTSPPFKYTRSIAYNGSYWLAAGTITVRNVTVKSFLDVISAESNAENTIGFHKVQGDYNSPVVKATVKSFLDQAKEIFNRYVSLNYNPQTYNKYSVHCFAKSTDGLSWKYVEECPFVDYNYPDSNNRNPGSNNTNQVRGLAWNGSKWMAVGLGAQTVTGQSSARIATSIDGDTWDFYKPTLTNETDSINLNAINSVTCDSLRWIIGTNTGIWVQGFTQSNWTRLAANIRRTQYRGIATNGSVIVGVGEYDGQTTQGPFGSGFFDMNLAASIVSSTNNGVSWSSRIPYETYSNGVWATRTVFKAVAWNGDKWVAVGQRTNNDILNTSTGVIAVSEDSVDWIVTDGFSSGVSCVSWDGNEWLVGSSNGNILISRDALQWKETSEDTTGAIGIGTSIILPILGGDINTVQSLLVGTGNPTPVLRTYDNENWIQQLLTDQKKYRVGDTPPIINSVLWSGDKWVMVGSQSLFKTIMTSENGIDWEYPSTTLEKGNGVAYNSGLYVAVGEGISPNGRLVTSSDAVTWTSRTCPISSLNCVGANGTRWVAGGNGGIIHSTNGLTWTKSTTCPLTKVNGIAWNGYYWVAAGIGPTSIFALSKDGIRWYQADSSSSSYLQEAKSLAWNGTLWVGVGNDYTNCILSSKDGYKWDFVSQRSILDGRYVAWTGTSWIVSGTGPTSFIKSTDTINWEEYPNTLSYGCGFATKNIILPLTGSSSSTVLDLATTVLADLTNKTNATIADEEAAVKLAQDQVAQAAILARRNAIKTESNTYVTQMTYWKNTVNTQFRPLTDKTYVDIRPQSIVNYDTAKTILNVVNDCYSSVDALRDIIYNNSSSQTLIEDSLELMKSKVKTSENEIKLFYNTIRLLYRTLSNSTYLALTPTSMYDSLYYTYGFPTQIRNRVHNFYIKKATAIGNLNNSFIVLCNTAVTDIIYSNNSSNAPDYASLYNAIINIDIETLFSATYETDDSNPYYYLTIINSLYPKILEIKAKCNEHVTNAQQMANNWANVLGVDPVSVNSSFQPLYTKYFFTLGPDFVPTIDSADVPNKKIVLTDIPIRAFKAVADTFSLPLSYPSALQILYNRLKTTTDSVASVRQTAINYMINKRKTVIKPKLDDIFNITKTKYELPLTLDQNLSDITAIVYNKNSDYQFCIKLLNLLKSAYVLYPTLKDKYLAIDLADIAAEEDGCVPPSSGWGTYVRQYATFNIDLNQQKVNISFRGTRYLLNETIKILGTKLVGGTSPTNDITINITNVGDLDGRISRYTTSGTLPVNKTYTRISGSRFQNQSLVFNVTPSSNTYNLSLTNGGSGYVVGQTILLPGSGFFRTSGTNDVLVTVTNVNSIGTVTGFTHTGSSQIGAIDNVRSYKNCSAKFTFLNSYPNAPNGRNFNILLSDPGTLYRSNDIISISGTKLGGLSPKNDVIIGVGNVTQTGSIIDFTYTGIPSTFGVNGQTVSQNENTTATFMFSNITSSSSFTCAIKNAGTGYLEGDRIIILGNSFPGGRTPANDFTIKVLSTSTSGEIQTFTVTSGNFGFLFQSYSRSGNVVEENATFNVLSTFYPTPSYDVTLNSGGNGYIVGETIVIPGEKLDGVTGINDLSITVSTVSNTGTILTFTSSGVPKTVFRVDTSPDVVTKAYVQERPGLHGWEKYNYTFQVRHDFATYIGSNSVPVDEGVYWTFKNPGILLGEGVPWREFLDFTKNSTYTSILNTITSLETKVASLNSNNKLSTSYIDGLVTADLAAIQTKYVPFATEYTRGLLNSVNKEIASAKFSVQITPGNYNVTLVNAGYGYVANEELTFLGTNLGGASPTNDLIIKVLTVGNSGQILTFQKKSGVAYNGYGSFIVTNNKLANRFPSIESAEDVIEANYLTLFNAPGLISGKTNSQIQTIANTALSSKNAIESIQNGEYPGNIQKAVTYLKYFNEAKTIVSTYQDDLDRWINMKKNAIVNTPYLIDDISNGNGDPFIMSIPPTDTNYWRERRYPTYTLTQFGKEIYECTLNQSTGKIETIVSTPLSLSDYSNYSPTEKYSVDNYVKFNNEIYKCIEDNSPDILDTTPDQGVKGINPTTNPNTWKTRVYPDVAIDDKEQEYKEDLSKLLVAGDYTPYNNTTQYGISSVVRSGDDIYYCTNLITNDSIIKGIPPTNTTYWIQKTYPVVTTVNGVNIEAVPTAFTPVDPATVSDVTFGNTYRTGQFGKAIVGFVDDSGFYREGTTTFQLDDDTETLLSKGYPPVFVYDDTHKYHNYSMWEYVQSGIKPELTLLDVYRQSNAYKKGDFVVYNGQFYFSNGVLSSSGNHTFKLIATYLADSPRFSNRAKGPLYTIPSNYPLATKSKGNLPTTTPWERLEIVSQNDSTPTYSNTQTYNTNDVVKYTSSGTTYKYKFVGTLPTYNFGTIAYAFFGTVSSNKSGWGIRSYPAVYYNGNLVDPTTVPALNPNDFPAYDDNESYTENTTVSYNGNVYMTRYSKINSIIGVPVTNENYWRKVRYQFIIYDGDIIEAIPGSIPRLNSDDFDEYNPNETYFTGDIIKVTSNQTNLNLKVPFDVVTTSKGDVYVIDRGNNIIKRVKFDNLNAVVVDVGKNVLVSQTNFVGSGPPVNVTRLLSSIVDGTTLTATFSNKLGAVAVDDLTDTIYFSDSQCIRKITSDGNITTYTSGSGYEDGNVSVAKFGSEISGLIFDKVSNCLYVSDTNNHRIRKISSNGTVTTLAGSTSGFANGSGIAAKFNFPRGIDLDSNGNIYVADSGNHCVRKVTPEGVVTRVAGFVNFPGRVDGTGNVVRLNSPHGIAIDSNDFIYVSEPINHCIRRISLSGEVITYVGSFTENNTPLPGNTDDYGTSAKLNSPLGMSFDKYNNLYVADSQNNKIRKIRTDSKVLSVVKDNATIYECVNNKPVDIPIVNIPPTNEKYWEKVTHRHVYIDDTPVQANPNNTDVFKPLNNYDYHKYDNNWMYKFGDRVSYNGKIYDCINAEPVGDSNISLTGVPPPNDIHWQIVDNVQPLGVGINGAKNWYNGKLYRVGDVVYYLKKIYKCASEHLSNDNDLPNRAKRWIRYLDPVTTLVPVWSNLGISYKLKDIVKYENKNYICVLNHTSDQAELPNRVMKWEISDQTTSSNIVFWELNIEYNTDTVLAYNGYFYRCEVRHYSTYDNSPEENKFYWSIVTDLTDVGLPQYYNPEASYYINDTVTLRVKNTTGALRYESEIYSTFTTATSRDGITWTGSLNNAFRDYSTGSAWRPALSNGTDLSEPSNNPMWVATGKGDGNKSIATSFDGINWTQRTGPFTDAGNGVAWNGSMWVAVGGGTNTIATSTDGITWTPRSNPLNIFAMGIVWNGTMWVAVGQGANQSNPSKNHTIVTSADGIAWTARESPFIVAGYAVAWNGSYFVATAYGQNQGDPANNITIATSTDGITWVARSNPINMYVRSVAWNGSVWVAVGNGTKTIATSTDGITWTGRNGVDDFVGRGVAWNGTTWVIVGVKGEGNPLTLTSRNGTTWTKQKSPFADSGYGITWNGSTFMASGEVSTMFTGPLTTVPNPESVYTIVFYKCIKSNANYPSEYKYDDYVFLPSKDGFGDYQTAKVVGTWQKNDLPRYGSGDKDPFRITGFAGKLRRRVWMEIEMPYRRVLSLKDYHTYRTIRSVDFMMTRAFSFTTTSSDVMRPSDYATDYNTIKNLFVPIIDTFIDSEVGYYEDANGLPLAPNNVITQLSIDQLILKAYDLLIDDLKESKLTPDWAEQLRIKQENIENINNYTYDSGTTIPVTSITTDGDNDKCIDQLVYEINTMKMQYFYNPGTQAEIREDPYKFMSAVALAQNPPKKLFRDLGVGDIDEIAEYLRTHPPTVPNVGGGKYTEQTLKQVKEANDILESKLELISLRCYELKLKLGVAVAIRMLTTVDAPGARIVCDSGIFDLPIGDWDTLNYYKSPPLGGVLSTLFDLINSSSAPPEYTLPTSQATRDLAVLTFESQNEFITKFLAPLAKGLVGVTAALFEGKTNVVSQLINGIASLHALVLESKGQDIDQATGETVALTTTNFSKFNNNNDSIAILKQQVAYYKNAVDTTEPKDELTEDVIINSLTRIGVILQYLATYERQMVYDWTIKQSKPIPQVVAVPSLPNQVIVKKPDLPSVQLKSNENLRQLRADADELRKIQKRLRGAIESLRDKITTPPLILEDLPTLVDTEIRRIIPGDPVPPSPYADKIIQTKIRLRAQNTQLFLNKTGLVLKQNTLAASIAEYDIWNKRSNAIHAWVRSGIFPPANIFPFELDNITYTSASISNLSASNRNALNGILGDKSFKLSQSVITNTNQVKTIQNTIVDIERQRVAIRFRLKTLNSLNFKFGERFRAANQNKTILEYGVRATTLEERLQYHEEQRKVHAARAAEIDAENRLNDALADRLQQRLDETTEELDQIKSQLTAEELERRRINIENDASLKRFENELGEALAEQDRLDELYNKQSQRLKVLEDLSRKATIERNSIYKQYIIEANANITALGLQKDINSGVVTLRFAEYERQVYGASKITGNWAVKALKYSVIIPFETLQATLALTLGVGELPYTVEEIITGRYFYDKLPPNSRARIDRIRSQLDAIPEALSTRARQIFTSHVNKAIEYDKAFLRYRGIVRTTNEPNSFKSIFFREVQKKPLSSRPTALFAKGRPNVSAGASSALRNPEGGLLKRIKPDMSVLGETKTQRFFGGLGLAMEVGGAAMAAWQGGAFSEGETLGF